VSVVVAVAVADAVDWASLAKQWIAQREVMGMTSVSSSLDSQFVSQHVPGPAAPPPPPPPPQSTDDVTLAPPAVAPPAGVTLAPPAGPELAAEENNTPQAHGMISV